MSDIADAVGIRKASLYHHVRKKEDLLFAIHEALIDELIAETMAVSSSSASPAEKVRELLHVTMRFIARNRDGVAVFLSERHAVTGERWQALVVKRDFYERMVSQIVTEGRSSGEFVDLPPEIVAKALLGMVNWGYTWFQQGGPLTRRRSRRGLRRGRAARPRAPLALRRRASRTSQTGSSPACRPRRRWRGRRTGRGRSGRSAPGRPALRVEEVCPELDHRELERPAPSR